MISVQALDKTYGEIKAVQGVTFEVQRGEIVGLLGHNGAGKTTVMKCMTGFIEPTAGTVSVGGVDVRKDRIGVQRQIGYLPESAPLYHEMLVQEYLLMMAELRSIPAAEQLKAVSRAVRATGLEKRLTQSIGTLSKGYRQRVGLAQAILHKPEVLVMDEPTNGLDPVQILEIRELIRGLGEHSTIILSTHILSEIEAVCDRVIILIDGQKAADKPLAEMLESNTIEVDLGGSVDGAITKLQAVEGVESARLEGGVYRLTCAKGAEPAPAVLRLAYEEEWSVREVAKRTPSLEQVFRDLMEAHAQQAKKEAA